MYLKINIINFLTKSLKSLYSTVFGFLQTKFLTFNSGVTSWSNLITSSSFVPIIGVIWLIFICSYLWNKYFKSSIWQTVIKQNISSAFVLINNFILPYPKSLFSFLNSTYELQVFRLSSSKNPVYVLLLKHTFPKYWWLAKPLSLNKFLTSASNGMSIILFILTGVFVIDLVTISSKALIEYKIFKLLTISAL